MLVRVGAEQSREALAFNLKRAGDREQRHQLWHTVRSFTSDAKELLVNELLRCDNLNGLVRTDTLLRPENYQFKRLYHDLHQALCMCFSPFVP